MILCKYNVTISMHCKEHSSDEYLAYAAIVHLGHFPMKERHWQAIYIEQCYKQCLTIPSMSENKIIVDT